MMPIMDYTNYVDPALFLMSYELLKDGIDCHQLFTDNDTMQ